MTKPPSNAAPPPLHDRAIRAMQAWWQHLQETGQRDTFLALVGASLLLFWAYWNSLCIVASRWDDPLYSHGYVVPLFALMLLYLRREPLRAATAGARWAGLGLLAAAFVLRLTSTYTGHMTPEMLSFVPALAGVFLLIGGWSLIRWAGPAVLFLAFMFPMPQYVKEHVLERLQLMATVASTFVLQTLGVAAYSEGKRIAIGEMQMGIVDACSGLRMAMNLVALVVAILLVTRRSWWERLIILATAVPIALSVNVVRITATGLFHLGLGTQDISETFHDWAGFAMMPLALGILWVEMLVLSHLIVEDTDDGRRLATAGIAGQAGMAAKKQPAPRRSRKRKR